VHTCEEVWLPERARRFRLVAGDVGLDFLNTADWHAREEPDEHLSSYPALADWCRQAGLIRPEDADALIARGLRNPRLAASALAEAITLREAAFRLLSGRTVDPAADLAAVNRALHTRASACRLVATADERRWEPVYADDLCAVIGPIAVAVSTVLVSGDPSRIRECEAPGCGWLFLDTSRTGNRRWCSMSDCGNRIKARRHYQRRRMRERSGAYRSPDTLQRS
jgi:predicted RNA-binding Zn ribbon-like protein